MHQCQNWLATLFCAIISFFLNTSRKCREVYVRTTGISWYLQELGKREGIVCLYLYCVQHSKPEFNCADTRRILHLTHQHLAPRQSIFLVQRSDQLQDKFNSVCIVSARVITRVFQCYTQSEKMQQLIDIDQHRLQGHIKIK